MHKTKDVYHPFDERQLLRAQNPVSLTKSAQMCRRWSAPLPPVKIKKTRRPSAGTKTLTSPLSSRSGLYSKYLCIKTNTWSNNWRTRERKEHAAAMLLDASPKNMNKHGAKKETKQAPPGWEAYFRCLEVRNWTNAGVPGLVVTAWLLLSCLDKGEGVLDREC